jgi:hypothetical protein
MPMPAVVISLETPRVDNAICLDNLTSEVAVEEPEITITNPIIPIDNNCTDNKLHLGMPGGIRDDKDESDKCDERDTIPTTSQPRRAVTELKRFGWGIRGVNGYEGEDSVDANVDVEEEASQAHNGSTHNPED